MASLAKIMKFYFSYELPFSISHVSNLEIKTSLKVTAQEYAQHLFRPMVISILGKRKGHPFAYTSFL